ncbi:hypothetical protein BHM03_00005191 [Ensete ventricosum]|nr:hypothetical protein BHM03_00005191 [Ensete ventricosum]
MDGRTYESIMGGYTWMINEGVPTAGPTVWSYAGSDFWSQKSNISRKTGYKQFTRRQPLAAARILCFSAIPGNLPVSLGLLLANSLASSLQTPNTLSELPMHSCIVIGRSSDDPMGSHWKFARRFAEGIKKLAKNTK